MKKVQKSRTIFLIVVFVFAAILFSVAAFADNSTDELVEKYLDSVPMDEASEKIPSETKKIFDKMGLDINLKELMKISPKEFFGIILSEVKAYISKPLKVTATIVGIIIINSLCFGLKNSFMEGSLGGVFVMVSVLSLVGFISSPIIEIIKETSISIKYSCDFVLSFIPVLSAVIIGGGFATAGSTYTIMLFFFCELMSTVCSKFFTPFMGIYFALSVLGSIVPEISLSSVSETIKKAVVWSFSLMTTVFVSFLSLQTIVSVGADTISFKAAKFVVGSFVPVIGNALSDALSTAHSCVNMMKNTIGAFGIIVIAIGFVPLIIKLCVWYLCINICKELGNLMGTSAIAGVLGSASFCIGILISIVLCFGLIVIVSTTIVMVWVSP
ncbi:MAG: hypothetical protein RR048_04540 [Oscillospiraceae bacterium]